jgi:hypothetical protein
LYGLTLRLQVLAPQSSVAADHWAGVKSSNSEKLMRPIFEAAVDRLGLGITTILAAANRYAVAASERLS